jgi:hypothetical protein
MANCSNQEKRAKRKETVRKLLSAHQTAKVHTAAELLEVDRKWAAHSEQLVETWAAHSQEQLLQACVAHKRQLAWHKESANNRFQASQQQGEVHVQALLQRIAELQRLTLQLATGQEVTVAAVAVAVAVPAESESESESEGEGEGEDSDL